MWTTIYNIIQKISNPTSKTHTISLIILTKFQPIYQKIATSSLDIKSLYTSIPNKESIEIIKDILHKNKSKLTQVITAFLWLLLTLNNFIFNNEHFFTNLGSSHGHKMCLIYANLFMNHFRRNIYLSTFNNQM